MIVEFFDISDAVRLREALAIRVRVFVEEQGVPPELELDEYDAEGSEAVHALVRDGADAVATGRYYRARPDTVRIGRMAVEATHRGRGAGALLLRSLMIEAKRHGFRRAELHAQVHARAFYARAGFVDDGERLWDAGIEHQPMAISLD